MIAMASTGRFSRRIQCAVCPRKTKTRIDAVNYCVVCEKFMCSGCVERHQQFPYLSGHSLLGQSQFESVKGCKILLEPPTEVCEAHDHNVVDMYCETHNSVGCSVCMTLLHKQCYDTHYIPHFLNFNSPNQVIDAKNRIQSTIEELTELTDLQEKAKLELEKSKAECIQAIKLARKDIDEAFDKLEEATLVELGRKFNNIAKDLQQKVVNAQQTLCGLKKRLEELQASSDNECQQFVCASNSSSLVAEAKKMCSIQKLHMQLNDGQIFKFVRNSEIMTFVEGLYTLGDLNFQTNNPDYQITRSESYSMHVADDDKPCEIISMSALESGDVILADYMNCRLKLLETTTYRIRDYFDLETERPVSVCKSKGMEAAVCLDSRRVKFVQVSPRGKIVPGRSIKLEHVCRGIAVMADQIYITNDGKRVYNYTMDGKLLRTFFKDRFEDEIFSHNREITASDDGKMLHVTDKDEGLITLDKMGNLLWTYTNLTLHTARGVSTDGSGNIFVVDYVTNNVILVKPDGRFLGEVVPTSKGIKSPLAVYFDKKNNKLLVAANSTNKLQVLTLKCTLTEMESKHVTFDLPCK